MGIFGPRAGRSKNRPPDDLNKMLKTTTTAGLCYTGREQLHKFRRCVALALP